MHDSVEAERRGKPAVAVCNRAFAAIARSTARMLGASGYEPVVLPRLLAGLQEREVEQAAELALDGVIRRLTRAETGVGDE